MLERFRINRQNFGRKCNVRKEFPKLPQKQRKIGPQQTWRLQKHAYNAPERRKTGHSKNKKSLGSASVFLRTKINLLETLVANRLPKIFLSFFKNLIH